LSNICSHTTVPTRCDRRGRRLDVTVHPFDRLADSTRRALDDEADRVARARGTDEARVSVE
jgi:hypothetical protein